MTPADSAVFAADEPTRDLAAFYLILAIEECSSLADHLLSDREWESPESAGHAFDLLAKHGVITSDLARRMHEAVGLRNLLVHEYAEADWNRVHAALRDPARLEELLRAVLDFTGVAS